MKEPIRIYATLDEHPPGVFTVKGWETRSTNGIDASLKLNMTLTKREPAPKPPRRPHQHSHHIRADVYTVITQCHPHGVGGTEIARTLNLHVCSVYRALRELKAKGQIEQIVRRYIIAKPPTP